LDLVSDYHSCIIFSSNSHLKSPQTDGHQSGSSVPEKTDSGVGTTQRLLLQRHLTRTGLG